MRLSITAGPGRNRTSLGKRPWKPGHNPRPRSKARPWAPLDGRIAGPGPHHRIDLAIGNDILIVITPSVTKR